MLEALKRLGVRVAIDDFGTGYSSLSYLQRLPLDGLKIDRSFIAALDADSGARGIVQVVIDLTHARGLMVTAEGVETLDQLEQLRGLGCDRAQGYYLAAPAPQHSVESLIPAEPA